VVFLHKKKDRNIEEEVSPKKRKKPSSRGITGPEQREGAAVVEGMAGIKERGFLE